MSNLRQSAEELISAIQKNEATLDSLARKLEEESAARFRRPGEVSKAGNDTCIRASNNVQEYLQVRSIQVDPVQLARRVRRLASELPELQAACQELLSLKQVSRMRVLHLGCKTGRCLNKLVQNGRGLGPVVAAIEGTGSPGARCSWLLAQVLRYGYRPPVPHQVVWPAHTQLTCGSNLWRLPSLALLATCSSAPTPLRVSTATCISATAAWLPCTAVIYAHAVIAVDLSCTGPGGRGAAAAGVQLRPPQGRV